jgi:hypothetical protein
MALFTQFNQRVIDESRNIEIIQRLYLFAQKGDIGYVY